MPGPKAHRAYRFSTGRVARGWAALGVLAAIASAAAGLLLPGQVGHAVGALAAGRGVNTVVGPLALLLGGATLASVIATLSTGVYTAAVTARLRAEVARSVLFEAANPGTSDLVTRLLVDARQPAAALSIATSAVISLASLGAGLVLLTMIDWWLLVGLVGGLLVLTVLLRRFVDDTTPLIARYREGQADIGQRLLDAQRGAVSIRAYGTWRRELDRVVAPLPSVRATGDAMWAAQRRFAWRTSMFVPAMQLVTIAVGGVSLSTGRITVGQFAAAVGYTIVVLGSLDGLESVAGLSAVNAARTRLAEVLRAPTAETGAWAPPPHPLDIVLEDVTVQGDGDRPILDRVSATIPAGAFVAITGPSGSGRSTLAAVISGRVEPTGGRVLVGGRPLADWDPAARAALITLAFARPPLLGDTVGGLISLGVDAGADTVRRSASQAHITPVIDALAYGFDTPLADLELSGGELQRLSIAQSLARSSSVLVLDDFTSSLDPATEREVVSALLAARADRTCIVVTDRPAVVRRADVVIALESGRIRTAPIGVLR